MIAITDIPNCTQCYDIGLDVPELLFSMEEKFGVETARAFLICNGGQEYMIPVRPDLRQRQFPAIDQWLNESVGGGRIRLPLGPVSSKARVWWKVAQLLKSGTSQPVISKELGLTIRTIERHASRLRTVGFLKSSNPTPRQSKETAK